MLYQAEVTLQTWQPTFRQIVQLLNKICLQCLSLGENSLHNPNMFDYENNLSMFIYLLSGVI